MDTWNILATSQEGQRPALLAVLRGCGVFRGAGYRNVAIGTVPDRAAFLDGIRERLAADARLSQALGRLVPIDAHAPIDPDDPVPALAPTVCALAGRLTGSFFVRCERRGLHGHLHGSELERALGGEVWRTLEEAGRTPRVDFRDPDHVLVIETLGERAGLGVVDRALREAYPFVRVR